MPERLVMREIQLVSGDGEFVAIVDILPFPDAGMPDIVSWGSRLFFSQTLNNPLNTQPERWVYREGFAVVSFTPSPGRPLKAVEET